MEQPKIRHTHIETTIHNGTIFKTAATIGVGLYLGYSLGKYVISLIDLVAERFATKTVDKIYKKE